MLLPAILAGQSMPASHKGHVARDYKMTEMPAPRTKMRLGRMENF